MQDSPSCEVLCFSLRPGKRTRPQSGVLSWKTAGALLLSWVPWLLSKPFRAQVHLCSRSGSPKGRWWLTDGLQGFPALASRGQCSLRTQPGLSLGCGLLCCPGVWEVGLQRSSGQASPRLALSSLPVPPSLSVPAVASGLICLPALIMAVSGGHQAPEQPRCQSRCPRLFPRFRRPGERGVCGCKLLVTCA